MPAVPVTPTRGTAQRPPWNIGFKSPRSGLFADMAVDKTPVYVRSRGSLTPIAGKSVNRKCTPRRRVVLGDLERNTPSSVLATPKAKVEKEEEEEEEEVVEKEVEEGKEEKEVEDGKEEVEDAEAVPTSADQQLPVPITPVSETPASRASTDSSLLSSPSTDPGTIATRQRLSVLSDRARASGAKIREDILLSTRKSSKSNKSAKSVNTPGLAEQMEAWGISPGSTVKGKGETTEEKGEEETEQPAGPTAEGEEVEVEKEDEEDVKDAEKEEEHVAPETAVNPFTVEGAKDISLPNPFVTRDVKPAEEDRVDAPPPTPATLASARKSVTFRSPLTSVASPPGRENVSPAKTPCARLSYGSSAPADDSSEGSGDEKTVIDFSPDKDVQQDGGQDDARNDDDVQEEEQPAPQQDAALLESLPDMKYRDLQSLARELGVGAGGKADAIRNRIREKLEKGGERDDAENDSGEETDEGHEEAEEGVAVMDVEGMKYRELQGVAKSLGLPASGTLAQLRLRVTKAIAEQKQTQQEKEEKTEKEERQSCPVPQSPAPSSPGEVGMSYEQMSYADLRTAARRLGVSATGSKAAILERIKGAM